MGGNALTLASVSRYALCMSIFIDVTGAAVSLDSPPARVVSLVPSVTETVFAIGAGARLVGRTRYCVRPDPEVRALEKVGGTKDPDIAKIVALKPDLVLANREENRKSDIEGLRAAGLRVFVDEPVTVGQGLAMVSLLGRMLDCEGSADAIVRQGAQELNAIRMRIIELDAQNALKLKPRSRTRPRVLAFIWRDPWMIAGSPTYIADMLRCLGAELAFDSPTLGEELKRKRDSQRYFAVDASEVAEMAPDILIFPDEPYAFTEGDFAYWREAAPHVPAVKEGRLRLCSGQDLSWFGSRTPGALQRLQPFISW